MIKFVGINQAKGRQFEQHYDVIRGAKIVGSAAGSVYGGIKKAVGSALGNTGLFHDNPLKQIPEGTFNKGNFNPYAGSSNNMNRNPGPGSNQNNFPEGNYKGNQG